MDGHEENALKTTDIRKQSYVHVYVHTLVRMHANSLEWSFVSKYGKLEELTTIIIFIMLISTSTSETGQNVNSTQTHRPPPISPLQKQIHWQRTAEGLGRKGCGRCPER